MILIDSVERRLETNPDLRDIEHDDRRLVDLVVFGEVERTKITFHAATKRNRHARPLSRFFALWHMVLGHAQELNSKMIAEVCAARFSNWEFYG